MSRSTSDAEPGLRVVTEPKRVRGKQGPIYEQGVSAELTNSKGLHLQRLSIPPGATERAHKHARHETAIFVVSGASAVWWGEDLQHHAQVPAGAFVYIAPDVPHMPYNPSGTEPCVCLIARTDPNEQESVTLLPDLEARWQARRGADG